MSRGHFGVIKKGNLAGEPEVGDAKKELKKLKIDLDTYKHSILAVYIRPKAPGFDFYTEESSRLLEAAKKSLGPKQTPKKPLRIDICKKDDNSQRNGPKYDPDLWKGMNLGGMRRKGLAQDNPHTAMGKFVGSNSPGKSFRQIGPGRSLHLIVGLNGYCNVHLDTTGFVLGHDGHASHYSINGMLAHGLYDYLPDHIPGAFVTWGDTGFMAPMVKPDKDPDGKTMVIFGFHGTF